jgi:HK97 family phage prohead protease
LDDYGDRIVPGAFANSLKTRKPKMLWQHSMDKPIGVWDEADEDEKGLWLKGRLAKTEKAQEARELAKMGAIDGLSIGFRTIRDEMEGNMRILKEIDLWEVSFVTIPADSAATLTGVKSAKTEREVEEALRSIGLSRREAKAFIANGWAGVIGQREADAAQEDEALRDAVDVKGTLSTLLERIGK